MHISARIRSARTMPVLSFVPARRPDEPDWGYGQMLGMTSRGGGLLGGLNGLAVAEADALDELAEALGAVEAAPVALG